MLVCSEDSTVILTNPFLRLIDANFLHQYTILSFEYSKYDLAAIYFEKEYDIPQKRKYVELEDSEIEKFTGRYEFSARRAATDDV